MKHKHTGLKFKTEQNPNKKLKELKQKQKKKIADWLYIETYRFYQHHSRMPDSSECDAVINTVYTKIKGAGIWIPFEEIVVYYQKKLSQYEARIQRELAEDVHYLTRSERLAEKAAKPKQPKIRKKKKKPSNTDRIGCYENMDSDFAFIAGYTNGGAPYGLRWEDVGIPSDLPSDVKRALYMEEYDLDE
jgi:hypothetical protein